MRVNNLCALSTHHANGFEKKCEIEKEKEKFIEHTAGDEVMHLACVREAFPARGGVTKALNVNRAKRFARGEMRCVRGDDSDMRARAERFV